MLVRFAFACAIAFASVSVFAAEKTAEQSPTATAESADGLVAKSPSKSELAVRAVVEKHFDGIATCDVKKLEEAWDVSAGRISFVSQQEGKTSITTGEIADTFKLWTAEKKLTQGEIESVDVVSDKMAMVKAKMRWGRDRFDDYLVLLNVDGDWKLVSKTYSAAAASFSPYGAP